MTVLQLLLLMNAKVCLIFNGVTPVKLISFFWRWPFEFFPGEGRLNFFSFRSVFLPISSSTTPRSLMAVPSLLKPILVSFYTSRHRTGLIVLTSCVCELPLSIARINVMCHLCCYFQCVAFKSFMCET